MSKVISFSISDRYLSQVKSLYPSLTDNLAVKQFVTDRLDSSLGSSLDDSLDGILDDKVKTLIETWVDGLLDERLDATVGKLITSLSERMARLESRLDERLDDGLDDMEYLLVEHLLKRERECSISRSERVATATSPIPNQEPVRPAIEPVPTVEDAVEPDSTIETEPGAIENENRETSPINDAGEDAIEKTQSEIARLLGVHSSTVTRWKQNKAIPSEYSDKCRFNDDKTKILWIYDRI